ncbi:unnamed protein product [Prorocentrum cordatum]|uniref:Uncharacterized protein n=1 Tax=Prorocentrum cordatum TaxID=2364126 RepID=A0ABN9RJB4_9DINO|nr:unnamed protein product [Polarella glacialis]
MSNDTWDCAACGAKGCDRNHTRCWECWAWKPSEGGRQRRRPSHSRKDEDQLPRPDEDARDEAHKKLAALRSRVRDLRAQAAEECMEFLGEVSDRVREEVRRLEAQKEQTIPRCFTQAQVERERRRAEAARDRKKKRIEALNAKAEEMQKELAEEETRLDKKEAQIQQLEAKRSQLKHTVPADAEGQWGMGAHHLEQAAALLQEQTEETTDTDLKAKHNWNLAALAAFGALADATGCAAAPIEWPNGPDLEDNAEQEEIDAHWESTAKAYKCNLDRYHGFADGDVARRQGHFQTEQFWEVTLAPVHKPPRGTSGEQASSCHAWQKQLKLNKAYQEVIDTYLLPLTAAEEGAQRARPDGPTADDWQNMKWVITNLGDDNEMLVDGVPYLEYWALKAGEIAEQEREAALAMATKEWRQWVQAHSVGGAGPLHKWTEPSTPWTPIGPPPSSPAAPRCGDPQRAADKVLKGWEERPPTREPKLAPLVPAEVCQHCMGFTRQRGLGAGQRHPHLWATGGAKGTQRIIDVFDAVEDGTPWPSSQSDILFSNAPKAEGGGMRCLGLLPEVVRLWETCRRPITAEWEACHKRDNDCSRAGRSSERGAWMQQLFCEAAAANNESYAITLLDLVKYFVYVRVVLDDAVTKGRRWWQGLAAVSVFAPVALKRVLMKKLDTIQLGNSLAELCLFFDGLSIARMGERHWVAAEHARMVSIVIERLKNGVEMPVSLGEKGKTVLLTSPTALAKDMEPTAKRIGIRSVSHAKHLGITVCAGPIPIVEWANAWNEVVHDPALADRLTAASKRWSIRLSQSPTAMDMGQRARRSFLGHC